MRLTSLTLRNYGNFQAETLTLDPRPGVLNLIVAPNGAGKSVLRAAFGDLLFGIGGQTPMNFRYGYSGMRIDAKVQMPDGQNAAFGRRRGHGNTLVDADDSPLTSARANALLGRMDRAQLERLFALDTERLRLGEADLLATNGVLADALEAGAGGVHHAKKLLKALEDERDARARSRKSANIPFYTGLDRYQDARRRLSASILKPDQWEKQRQALQQHEQRQAEQNRIAEEASAEIALLERIRRVVPSLLARDRATAWLDAHPDAPALDPALKQKLDATRASIVLTEERARGAAVRAGQLTDALRAIVVDAAVLAEGATIDALTGTAGAARKAAADLPSRTSELLAADERIRELLQNFGSPLPPDRAAEAIPNRIVINRARELIRDHAARTEARLGLPEGIALQSRAILDLNARIAALPAIGDYRALAALLREIRAAGEPIRSLRDAEAAAVEIGAERDAALARVPGWTGSANDLVQLAPLSVDAFDDKATALERARDTAAERLRLADEASAALDAARVNHAALVDAIAVPDEAALRRAREHRDTGWQLIYRHAFTDAPPASEEELSFTGGLLLPIAFERAVSAADTVADRRFHEASAIERFTTSARQVEEAEIRLQRAESSERLARESIAEFELDWRQSCANLKFQDMPSMRDVRRFLMEREKVVESARRHHVAHHAFAALHNQHAIWSAQVTALLGQTDDPGLELALTAADRSIDAASIADTERVSLITRREAAEKTLEETQARLRAANLALTEWQQAWDRALADLGRPAGEHPSATAGLIDLYGDLDRARSDAATLRERIRGMQADNAGFSSGVVSLVASIAPDLATADPFAAVSELRTRLQTARERHEQHALLSNQNVSAIKEKAETEQSLGEQRAVQSGILQLIGAASVEVAESRLRLAAERAQHVAAIAEADAALSLAGDGQPIERLRQDVDDNPGIGIARRMEHAAERRRQAQTSAQEAAAAVSRQAQEMDLTEQDRSARDAAADQQAAVATIGRVLEEALVLHTAAELLRVSMAAVEQQSGDSATLRRISEWFGTLTNGAYTRVIADTEREASRHLILVQRDYPEERQTVGELSEGTRDQLYLALRLAAIENHVASEPGLPFIGDDILQTFDNDRALATMRSFLKFSETAQVILLTHHRHLEELAATLPAGTVCISRLGVSSVDEHGLS